MTMWHFSTILIIISGSLYPTFALGTSQTCDTSILPPRWPSSHIYITDTNGRTLYAPLSNHAAIFHDDDVWNASPYPRTVQVTLTIRYHHTGPQVFNQTQSLQMQACSGPESVKWRFVPIQFDDYSATVSDNRGKVGMIFYSILDATKSQTVSSPLEQLRFGADSHNVICRQDLQLVIKSEDGSPACVKSDTTNFLIERGWATTFGTGNDHWTLCKTPYRKSDYGIPVLYIPTNSLGKLCIKYYSINNPTTNVGIRIFESSNMSQSATEINYWTYNSTLLQGNKNTTIEYFIQTGNNTGFYGLSISGCGGIPFAVGYDSNSTITTSNFPWAGHVFNCPALTYNSQIDSTDGIGVRYIPYSGMP